MTRRELEHKVAVLEAEVRALQAQLCPTWYAPPPLRLAPLAERIFVSAAPQWCYHGPPLTFPWGQN
jgi:hypothetical protein